jgi:two-component system chemotaxis response regulator CheB
VEHPTDGQRIEPSAIYVAPPDHHMIIEGEYILIKKGPKENRFRPCIDTLFRSAAYSYKENVIGVILTGMLDDGSSGMWSVKRMGGITIVQDPAEALYASMPSSVLQYTDVDYVLPLSKISALLTEIVAEPIKQHAALDEKQEKLLKTEIEIAGEENGFDKGILEMGDPSNLTCPDCGGAMARFTEGEHIRFRCHTGHAFSTSALLGEVKNSVEKSLWQAVRSVEESVMILEQAATNMSANGRDTAAVDAQHQAMLAMKDANTLRGYIYDYINRSITPLTKQG